MPVTEGQRRPRQTMLWELERAIAGMVQGKEAPKFYPLLKGPKASHRW